MAEPGEQGAVTVFSTQALPERDRLAAWREFYAGKLLRLDWEPNSDLPFEARVAVRKLPDLTVYRTRYSPAHVQLTRELIGQEDNVTLFLPAQPYRLVQAGRDIELAPGEATLLSSNQESAVTCLRTGQHMGVILHRPLLRMLSLGADDMLMRRIPRGTEELILLKSYLRLLHAGEIPLAKFEMQQMVATHIHDLIGLVLRAAGAPARTSSSRGLAAARLAALKSDILHHLGDRGFSIDELARRHGISPRYVRQLFAADDTSASDFLRNSRLERAYRMLTTHGFRDASIARIAYEAGFGDLSHFNHAFRRRYHASPSEVRSSVERHR
jgi:AraC-like DNA-binding protein